MANRNIITRTIRWRDYFLTIRERHSYIWPDSSHIEIYVVRPKRAKIPITDTGYRSHFINTEELSLAGGTVAFVTHWLEAEAATKKWQQADAKARQGSFDF